MDSFQGLTTKSPSSWHRPLAPSPIFYDHVNPVTRRIIDQSAGGKLRDRNAEESWALLEDLALYENEIPPSSNTELICTKEEDGDVMFIEIVPKDDNSRKEEPEAGEQEVKYFDIFPTRSELAYHKIALDFEAPRAHGFVLRSLELQSSASLWESNILNLID
ncbi:hypothetical protein Tco_1028701 [Tanacetum coccineum]|uniref:Uncharacterized protein n=1 Tax=Tanacetum coccineum TaxID=301880 RepID=A0ABQ5G1P5_9ASTR